MIILYPIIMIRNKFIRGDGDGKGGIERRDGQDEWERESVCGLRCAHGTGRILSDLSMLAVQRGTEVIRMAVQERQIDMMDILDARLEEAGKVLRIDGNGEYVEVGQDEFIPCALITCEGMAEREDDYCDVCAVEVGLGIGALIDYEAGYEVATWDGGTVERADYSEWQTMECGGQNNNACLKRVDWVCLETDDGRDNPMRWCDVCFNDDVDKGFIQKV